MESSATKIPGLEIESLHESRAALVTLTGQMDRSYYDQLNEALFDMVESGCRYFIGDLSQGTQIGSTGVGMIGYYAQQLRERGGEVVIVKPPQRIARVIELTKFDDLVKFLDTREEALEYVAKALGA